MTTKEKLFDYFKRWGALSDDEKRDAFSLLQGEVDPTIWEKNLSGVNFQQFAANPSSVFSYAGVTEMSADQYKPEPTAASNLANVESFPFPKNGSTADIKYWVKRVADAGQNPYDLLPGAGYTGGQAVGIYDAVETLLDQLGVTKYTMPKIDLGGGVTTDPAKREDDHNYNRGINPVMGYDKDGNPVHLYGSNGQHYDPNSIVYKTRAEYDAAEATKLAGGGNQQGQGNILGYDTKGNPIYQYDENGNPSDTSGIKYSTYEKFQAARAAEEKRLQEETEQRERDKKAPLTNAEVGRLPSGSSAAQSLNDASWMYGTGADFAQYANFPWAPANQGGQTWKPGTILGQEAQNRYLAGNQFAQYLPNAFAQVVAATPQQTPTPTWASFSQGLNTPGQWAAGYPQNISVGGRASQTGQYTQPTQTQAQQFTPYNTTAPYGFPQQQYNQQSLQTPWYSGLAGTQQAATTPATTTTPTSPTGTTLAGSTTPTTTATETPETSLTGTKVKQTTPTQAPYPLTSTARTYSSSTASLPQTWAGEFANVGNQALYNQQGQSTLGQMQNLASPYNTAYGTPQLRSTTQNYALNPQTGASGRAQGTEGQVSNAVTGQLNQNVTQNPLYQQAQSALSTQLGQQAPMTALNTAITGAINPMEIYNKQLQDTLYADQTRRLDEDYTKQLQEAKDYYGFYGLSGSSAEKKAMDDMNLSLARKKEDIKNTLDAQMVQKAQALEAQRLPNLTGAYSTLGAGQNAAINSSLSLMDYPQAQQRAAAGLGLGLLGQQQTGAQDEYSRLMQSLNEGTGAQGQSASILNQLAGIGTQQYGQASDTAQWSANYFDQLAQTERANALQDYLMQTQEAQYGDTANQQNFQNLQTLLGLGTGLYDTYGTQGWNQMRTTATDLANMATGWNQQAATNQAGNNWWQALLGAVPQSLTYSPTNYNG